MRSIRELKNIKGKTALVLVDFNVPVKGGAVEDDFRIRKALPTLEFLQKKGAKLVLLTHLGKDGKMSLAPVIKRFFELSKMSRKKVEFFENVRKFSGEAKNDPAFARRLASLGDFYVNEAFSVSHRAHASVVGVPKYLPSYAGFQLEAEVKNLSRAFQNPKRPFLFILGGAKFSTKMPLIKKYLKLADKVFVGGALANDFFRAKGYEIGKSLADKKNYEIKSLLKNKKLILPEYVLVKSRNKFIEKGADKVGRKEIILDVGEKSIKNIAPVVRQAKMILWNGPLGKYEAGGGGSTKKLLKLVASARAESIIGGGDTVSIISEMKIEKKFSFVSIGGGAALQFLAKGTLPGLKALA